MNCQKWFFLFCLAWFWFVFLLLPTQNWLGRWHSFFSVIWQMNVWVFPVQGQVSCACVDTVSGLKTLEKLQEWGFLNLSTKEGAESKALWTVGLKYLNKAGSLLLQLLVLTTAIFAMAQHNFQLCDSQPFYWEDVPFHYRSGSWGGFFLIDFSDENKAQTLQYYIWEPFIDRKRVSVPTEAG